MKKLVILSVLLLAGCQSIDASQRGIVTEWGRVTGEVKEPGLHWYNPFTTSIQKFDVSIKRSDIEASAASKDLQSVSLVGALNYQYSPEIILELYRNFGFDFENRVIKPSMQEAVKSVTAEFAAEELITKRKEVSEKISAGIKTKLEPYGIKVQDFNIINFNFSGAFNEAIEAKVTAEQNALAAKNKLEQVKYEADQKVAEAEGKAKALKVESEAISNDPKILELRAIEKWNGVLPVYNGSVVPFINIK